MDIAASTASLQDKLTSLLDPLTPAPAQNQPFIFNGATFGDIRRMAADLLQHFPKKNSREKICLATEDKVVFAAALLAALAGGPILLLPFAFSDQALNEMQTATGYRALISDQPRDLPSGVRRIVLENKKNMDLSILSATPLALDEDLLALYTGGSTGTPQIWPKTLANILGEGLFLAKHFQVTAQDRIVATVSPYHIYGLLYSVVLPLVSGAAVFGRSPSYPEEIIQSAQEIQATLLISVPPHYRALRDKPSFPPCLRLAFSSAGMLDDEDNKIFSQKNNCGIIEVYGSTETGGVALRNRSKNEEGFTPYPIIDWNIKQQRLYIDSPYLSPNLSHDAQGYFVTGDLVEMCAQHAFILKGRADSITKIAGKRVDLEEIRNLIKAQANIRDCLVLALHESGARAHRIVALVEAPSTTNAEDILRALSTRLEAYALPRMIKIVDRMPIKENGKYDRPAILRLLQ